MTTTASAKVIGLALVVTVAAAVAVGLGHDSSAAAAPPLSAADHAALTANAPLVESMPRALAEVPQAASDVTKGRVSVDRARQIIAGTPGLRPLADAISAPQAATGQLTATFRAVVTGAEAVNPATLPAALTRLQTVQAQIAPAVRLVAARSGHPLSAAAALSAIEADRSAPAVAALVGRWPQIYGTFVLIEQAVA
ncbi:MAG: hypothetical protein JO214_12370 [Frankiaceae bacterium]|nr:hypothetical protein [Frankiaceae bacterium]